MKSTGIVRRIDALGRIVIPTELRKTMELDEGTSMEMFVEGGRIIFEKYERGCIFYGKIKNVIIFEGKLICEDCIDKIYNIY